MSHKKASTDPGKDLHLYSRIGMYNEKVLSVFNADGTDYDFSDVGIEIGVKRNRGDEDLLTLTEGNGITVTDNDIHFVFTEDQSSLFTQRTYYWQLRRTIDGNEKVWLNGDHDWHNGKFDSFSNPTSSVTISDNGEAINITVNDAGASVTLESLGATLQTAANDTPLDADTFHFWDAVDSILKKVTWSNIKSTLKTYFDTLYGTLSSLVEIRADIDTAKDVSENSSFVNQTIFSLVNSGIDADWWDGVSVINKDDTLYHLGGWNTTGPTVTNKIFKSTDGGVTWSNLGNASWSARHSFGCGTIGDYHYVVGSDYLGTTTEKKEVWRTDDLDDPSSWELLTNDAEFGARILFGFCVFKEEMYVLGGQISTDYDDGVFDDIWKSADGITWTQVSSGHSFLGKNISGAVTVFNGRIYVVAGGRYDDVIPVNATYDQTVYSSADGVTWVQESNIPVVGVQYPNLIVWDGKLWLMNGAISGGVNQNTVSFMDKSGVWHTAINYRYSSYTPFTITANHAAGMVVYKDSVLRINGNNTNSVFKLSRSQYMSSDQVLTFLTPIQIESIKTPTFAITDETGLINYTSMTPLLIEFFRPTTFSGNIFKVKNSNGQIQFHNTSSGDSQGYFEYAAQSFDLYFSNVRYWRWLSNGGNYIAGNSASIVGISGGGILWSNASDNYKPYWTRPDGTVYNLSTSRTILWKNNVSQSLTGTLTETLVRSQLISANTIQANDVIDINAIFTRVSGANNAVVYIKINTSASLAGATQLAQLQIVTTNRWGVISRKLVCKNSTSSQLIYNTTNNAVTDIVVNANAATSLSIDFTVNQYLLISIDLDNTGDSVTSESVLFELIR